MSLFSSSHSHVQKLDTISLMFSKLKSWDKSSWLIVTLLSRSICIVYCLILPNYCSIFVKLSIFSLLVKINKLNNSCWSAWWYYDFFKLLTKALKSFSTSLLLYIHDLIIFYDIFFYLFPNEWLFLNCSEKYLDLIFSIPSRYPSILFCLIKSSISWDIEFEVSSSLNPFNIFENASMSSNAYCHLTTISASS